MAVTTPEDLKTIQAKVYDVPRSATKLVDIKPEGDSVEFPEIVSFDYYESLHDSFITAQITIFDSSGKIDKAFNECGVRQFCPVEITLYDPSYGKEWIREIPFMDFSGSNCFYVSRVVNQITRGKKKQYTLELVNKDSLVALSRTIRSAWPPDSSTKVDYNTVVDDVLKKYIKTSKDTSMVMVHMTESVAKVMGNNMKPYQLIDNICTKATPKASGATSGKEETRPAGYVFHEVYDQYRFDSIHKLLTSSEYFNDKHGVYTIRPVNDGETPENVAAYVIQSYKFYDGETQSSLLEEVAAKKRGKPKTKVLDVSRNIFKEIEKLPPKTTSDKCLVTSVDEDFGPVTVTTQTEYQFEYYNSCDETALDNEPTNPEITSMNYGAMLDMLKNKTSTIKVPGNLSLSAGDQIVLEVPEIKPEGDKGSESSAKYSGNYLITKINHKVVDIETVITVMQICKLIEA